MIRKYIFGFILVIGMFKMGTAQEIISYSKLGSYSIENISQILGLPAKYAIDVYKVIYTTEDVFMENETASGIVAVPDDSKSTFPFMIYDHGTVADRHDVPSEGSFEQFYVIGLAAQGYVCVAPDYIGLGKSKGLHPYIHPESEATAGIDLVLAAQELMNTLSISFNEQLFITGYSQGGHAAMATSKMLQETGELKVTAAAPMSGPFSISEVMREFTLGDSEYFFCAYLGSVCLTAIYAYPEIMQGIEVENLFLPEYAELVRQFEMEEIDLFQMNDAMIELLSENGGKVLPKRMFKPNVIDEIWNNPDFPLFKALIKMDVYDWVPEMPMKMLYCTADDQVSFENAVFTNDLMNGLGAEQVSAEDVFPLGDHGQCVLPATFRMVDFFSNYQQITPVNTVGTSDKVSLQIWPNPVTNQLHLKGTIVSAGDFHLELFDLNGKKQLDRYFGHFNGLINLSSVPKGIYALRITDKLGLNTMTRVVVAE